MLEGDVCDAELLGTLFVRHGLTHVAHLAAQAPLPYLPYISPISPLPLPYIAPRTSLTWSPRRAHYFLLICYVLRTTDYALRTTHYLLRTTYYLAAQAGGRYSLSNPNPNPN